FLLVLIWVTDSAAYFSGKRWGRRKLAQRVSPGKSWEGVIISLLAVALLSVVSLNWLPGSHEKPMLFVLLCVVTAACSVLGDLLESLIKRCAELKDSGSLLPGHGGILDRIDSLTAASPIFLAGLILMGKSG
ncbi:MAG: phosphatidate cytidylyltransferase, partial [Thiotrichales bacterium]|nr:phosphatidate cytidylyltransferase [Thiotrichales bacterium]